MCSCACNLRFGVYRNVVEKLHRLPAELVARRLTRLLLSRFVLLDQSADKELAPHFLHPCQGVFIYYDKSHCRRNLDPN